MNEHRDAPLMGEDPFAEFAAWYKMAVASKAPYPEAMTLATIKEDGRPAARTVLYKGIADGGFQFFTNYESAKSLEIKAHPNGALVFFWPEIYRQLRIEGSIEKTSRAESEAYFATRARDSQLGAWASSQSREVPSADFVDRSFEAMKKKFENITNIPCPPHWGGFRLRPQRFEFWTGNPARLHYRYFYELKGESWKTGWLAP